MKKIICTMVLLLFIIPLLPKDKKKDNKKEPVFLIKQNFKELNARYQRWMNMVTYTATEDEKRIFMKLPTIMDRDMYLKIFWKQRDPTPGTEENEYRNKIERRFKYVNKYFRRGSSKPGWKTDMGKIYMILGKPNSIETFDSEPGLYPAQVWYYYGDKKLGLPTYFNVTFFKRFGVGEWVRYDPVSDGPVSLIITGESMDTSNYPRLYRKIKKLAPNLATPSLSMIPNQIPYAYIPSPRNNLIMANIFKSPTKIINTSYATNFLKYKGFVDIESSINYVKSTKLVTVTKDSKYDYNFINFSIKPKRISVNYNQERDKYYFNMNLVVSLKQKEHIIYEYSKNFDYYFDEDKINILKAGGIVIHDYFPAIPGKYQLRIFIQNKAGNEFSYADTDLEIPIKNSKPYFASPLLGYKKKDESKDYFYAYKINNQKLSVDPEKTFTSKKIPFFLVGVYNLNRQTWENGKVEWELKGLSERNNYRKKGIIIMSNRPFQNSINLIQKIPENTLRSDYYELTLRLFNNNGILIDTVETNFIISPMSEIPRPTEMYSKILTNNPFYFNYILGLQYQNIGHYQKAESFFERSFNLNPNFTKGIIAFLKIETQLRKFAKVLKLVERLKNDKKLTFNYHQIKGEALYGLKKYREAIKELLQANKIYNSDIKLINMIGKTFLKLGNQKEALKAFEASILINKEQSLIQKFIIEIKKGFTDKK